MRIAKPGFTDLMLVFSGPRDVETISPNFSNIVKLKERGIIVTAQGERHGLHFPFLRSCSGHQRRFGNGLCSYDPDTILEQTTRQNGVDRTTSFRTRRLLEVQSGG